MRIRKSKEFQQQGPKVLFHRKRRQPGTDPSPQDIDGFLCAKTKIVAQQFKNRLKWRCLAVRQHASLKDPNVLSATILSKLEAESAFSNSGLADNRRNTAIALHCAF